MAVKPIISIDVNDDAFKRFYTLFQQYQNELEEQPETWRKLGEAMGESTAALEGGAVSGREALALAAAQATIISEALRDATKAQTGLETATKRSGKAMDALRKGAEGVGSAVKAVAGGLLKLASFAGLGGLFAGFGIGSLANAAFNRYRESGQLGLTPGQLASFQVNAQPFLTTQALEAAANAQIDLTKAGQLSVLGISYRRAQSLSTADLAFEELKAARAAYLAAQQHGLPPLQSPQVMSYLALGGNLGELRFAAQQPLSDLEAAQRATRNQAGALGFDRQTALAWTNLKKELDRAGVAIESSLIQKLAPLAPDIERLTKDVVGFIDAFVNSKNFDKTIDDLKSAFEGLLKFIETTDWKALGDEIGAIVDKLRFLIPGGTTQNGKGGGFDWNPFSDFNQQQNKDFINGWRKLGSILFGGAKQFGGDLTQEVRSMFSSSGTQVAGAWKFLNSPIAGPAAAAVTQVASQKGVDPVLALATAMNESGLNPKSVGDSGDSLGLFQLNKYGEGAGMSDADRFDARKNANVALSVLAEKMNLSPAAALNEFSKNIHRQYALMHRTPPSHADIMRLAGSPGLYAAIAQRPRDPFKYARDVNELYKALIQDLPNAHGSSATALQKALRKAIGGRTPKPATVSIYNSTAARVAISTNAAGLG